MPAKPKKKPPARKAVKDPKVPAKKGVKVKGGSIKDEPLQIESMGF